MSLTISQTITQLRQSLQEYIEAAYHISHPILVAQRRALLEQPGVVYQPPFLESTPRYKTGLQFSSMNDLPASVRAIFALKAADTGTPLVFDPPFEHQALAVRNSVLHGKSQVVITGTGSGKTECFLLPALAKLAIEAQERPQSFQQPAVRVMVLYPMNALVNDQLGRIRLLFGDASIVGKFRMWSGRPARFARYTSRTPYPGLRTVEKDGDRLKPFRDFYVRTEEDASNPDSPTYDAAKELMRQLRDRGKWPAKANLRQWFGGDGQRYQRKDGTWQRCVTLANDAELLTRHEVQAAPPDLMVTNYSMLEYMLMRPIERPIFDATRQWLADNPKEQFLLVLDETHLYRGAPGAEVALLVRRLRMRLQIPAERLQVICTSASFHDPDSAVQFGAALSGKDASHFAPPVRGQLLKRSPATKGGQADAIALAAVDVNALYGASTEDEMLVSVAPLFEHIGRPPGSVAEGSGATPGRTASLLWHALHDYPPLNLLVNESMGRALAISDIGAMVFEGVEPGLAEKALTTLTVLGSMARDRPDGPNLLPCRVHSFFRGLPGLWTCLDPECSGLPVEQRGGPAGTLFGQPRAVCSCGTKVFELFTCRSCGSAHARAYTNDIETPTFLWSEPGTVFRETADGQEHRALSPIDLLLENPVVGGAEPADLDLMTGRLNPPVIANARIRTVYIKAARQKVDQNGDTVPNPGLLQPCAVCGEKLRARSSVQDLQTKGDQPFAALVKRQIQVQPPAPGTDATSFAPLRGRKVLIFSDSRQTAARLAPTIQNYATQDALRPLLIRGYRHLLGLGPNVIRRLCLDDLYCAILIGAADLNVRLRPTLKGLETFHEFDRVLRAVKQGVLADEADLLELMDDIRNAQPPEVLLNQIRECVTGSFYGLQSLALASVKERGKHTALLQGLPTIVGIADTNDQKLALARAWINGWRRPGIWFSKSPVTWWNTKVEARAGGIGDDLDRLLVTPQAKRQFRDEWVPPLINAFTEKMGEKKYRAKAAEMALDLGDGWAYCRTCRHTQRPFPGVSLCSKCGQSTAEIVDPATNVVFQARKGYYRAATIAALANPPEAPIDLIAAEHTAAIGKAMDDENFSEAEQHELLFQDVDLGLGPQEPSIDVLSCTTTMEVGIDIGKLSGVALRNMPPSRANYQQRSGRAGRRGNAIATVIAYGNADTHDEQYFTHPEQMISGPVTDPKLTLDNPDIVVRHITAYVVQRYHQDRMPSLPAGAQPQLFEVLGTVGEFLRNDTVLNRHDLEVWLSSNAVSLRTEIDQWLPTQLSSPDRTMLLDNIASHVLDAVDYSLAEDLPDAPDSVLAGDSGLGDAPPTSGGPNAS